MRMHFKRKRLSTREWAVSVGKYIETGTRLANIKVASHAVGIIARCGKWVGGRWVLEVRRRKEEENIETDTEQQPKESVIECKKSWWSGHNNTWDNIILRKQ